jgi:hypothetical protein
MPTSFRKYLKKIRRKSRTRDVQRVSEKFAANIQKDLVKGESDFNELLVNGEVPTNRRKDGTVVLRETTNDDGQKVPDDNIDQLISVDMFKQNYDEREVDNIIKNNITEILPDAVDTEDKIRKFFLDYELLKGEIDNDGSETSHQRLVDVSSRFIPTPEAPEPLPIPENILGNGVFEDGELPEITSKILNSEIIDDPTEIRPTAKILRLWGSQPGHMILHKLEDKTIRRNGLYECSYLVYVSEDYDGSHGVEFTKWGNLDPDLTVMTPIGNLPFDDTKQLLKVDGLEEIFGVKVAW